MARIGQAHECVARLRIFAFSLRERIRSEETSPERRIFKKELLHALAGMVARMALNGFHAAARMAAAFCLLTLLLYLCCIVGCYHIWWALSPRAVVGVFVGHG